MNKILNNSKNIKNVLLIVISSLICLFSLIYLIQSYSYYSDEWGTDISLSEDAVVLLLVGVALLIYSIINVVSKNELTKKNSYYLSYGIASAVIAFYPLGRFFKSLAKSVPYIDCQNYLYIGILGLFLLGYIVFSYFANKNE